MSIDLEFNLSNNNSFIDNDTPVSVLGSAQLVKQVTKQLQLLFFLPEYSHGFPLLTVCMWYIICVALA